MPRKHLAKLITLCAIWPGLSFAASLAEVPLSLRGSVPPNVVFSISVEYPTANTAAYQGASDYTQAGNYLGLFDKDKCYDYDSGNGYFVPVSSSTTHECAGHWSGNFLNWVSMTGLDAFRYAMTGGNRAIDTPTLTVLERTHQSGQGGTGNFANKTFNPSTNAQFANATPFSFNTTYTVVNQGKGVTMTLSGTETTTTSNTAPQTFNATTTCKPSWTATAPYCSQFKATVDGTERTGTCTAWSGAGTNANPYICTAFSNFSTINVAPGFNSTGCINKGSTGGKYFCRNYDTKFTYDVTTTTTTNNVIANTYNVRVKVCDTAAGLEPNCAQYGTSYKPIGVIQENGEKMRFGVFSYFNANHIDNAVMRSPLKYVAPDRYTTAGATANDNREWDPANGTLYPNPDATWLNGKSHTGAILNSGVINYLNKFGSFTGSYKTYDTVGKLYYETLNYLRGRPPTVDFYNGATVANGDSFPVINNSWTTDPQEYSCQQNYIIAMGDTHTWCDKRLPGGSYTNSNNGACNANGQPDDKGSLAGDAGINVTTYTNLIGNNEGVPNLATKYTGAGPSASYYMGGLAYWAATHDIRPDDAAKKQTLTTQNVKTYVIDVEEYRDLGIGSQYWLAAKYGGADSYTLDGNGNPMPNDWSDNVTIGAPFADYTGPWPKALLRAGDPAMMIAAVRNAIAKIVEQIGTNSALSQSTTDLRTSDGAYIYRAIFNSEKWSGDMQAYKITVATDGTVTVDPSPAWEARTKVPAAGQRVVLTYNDGLKVDGSADSSNTNAHKGVAFDPAKFDSPSNLSERQRDLLNRDNASVTDNFGADRMRYMRGESSNEGNTGHKWRSRGSAGDRNVLGDMINSNPVYVSRPAFGLSGGNYADFVADNKNRKPMLYVGANDGMLHAFDASLSGGDPGKELLAYVPSAVYPRLSQLMAPTYNHKYFVDGSPTISEACFGSCSGKGDWKTMLVGGLNAGGQGIYALDVTNPDDFTQANAEKLVLWEFTDRDDADLGYTFSKPILRKMNNGKWAVIFGNGFNSTANDTPATNRTSTTGRAYLYIAWVDGPSDKKWDAGTGTTDDYIKIELPTPGETNELTNPNGLASAAAIDADLDGTADIIYAGDRKGQIWKIDVSSSDPKDWKPDFGTDAEPQPLFSANYKDKDDNTIAQGVTTGIEVSSHPNGGYLVLFGTGSFIDTTDNIGPFKTDSFYGIWDKNDGTTRLEKTDGRTKLQKQAVLKTITDGGEELLFMSRCIPNYSTDTKDTNAGRLCPDTLAFTGSGQQLGWYFDLPDDGERVVSELPLLQSTILTFTTVTPSDDPCTGNTIGREYNIDYLTGGAALVGVFDLNQDGKIDENDMFNLPDVGDPDNPLVAPSGRVLKGGKSDTGVRFTLPRAPTGTDRVCSDFIPGWGCPSEMAPQRNCSRWVYDATSAEDLTKIATSGIEGMKKCLPGKPGRFTWRQIND